MDDLWRDVRPLLLWLALFSFSVNCIFVRPLLLAVGCACLPVLLYSAYIWFFRREGFEIFLVCLL